MKIKLFGQTYILESPIRVEWNWPFIYKKLEVLPGVLMTEKDVTDYLRNPRTTQGAIIVGSKEAFISLYGRADSPFPSSDTPFASRPDTPFVTRVE